MCLRHLENELKLVQFNNVLLLNVKSMQFKNGTLGTTVYARGCGIQYAQYEALQLC